MFITGEAGMNFLTRLARLEQRRPPGADLVYDRARAAFALLAGADGDGPVPSVAEIVATWRRGSVVSCRSHVLRLCDDGTLFDRWYPGVDLDLLTGRRRADDHPMNGCS